MRQASNPRKQPANLQAVAPAKVIGELNSIMTSGRGGSWRITRFASGDRVGPARTDSLKVSADLVRRRSSVFNYRGIATKGDLLHLLVVGDQRHQATGSGRSEPDIYSTSNSRPITRNLTASSPSASNAWRFAKAGDFSHVQFRRRPGADPGWSGAGWMGLHDGARPERNPGLLAYVFSRELCCALRRRALPAARGLASHAQES
jgi:hypothetical protein